MINYILPNLVHPKKAGSVDIALGFSAAALGSIFCSHESIKIIGYTVLTGAIHGMFNHIQAYRESIQSNQPHPGSIYFTIDYYPYPGNPNRDHRLVKSANYTLSGTIWGIYATWKTSLIAGFILSLISLKTTLSPFTGDKIYFSLLAICYNTVYTPYAEAKDARFWMDHITHLHRRINREDSIQLDPFTSEPVEINENDPNWQKFSSLHGKEITERDDKICWVACEALTSNNHLIRLFLCLTAIAVA